MNKNLYIIGNGFDLHHNINSKYIDFREWIFENNIDLICKIEEIYGICSEEWWSNFEEQLAYLDVYGFSYEIAYQNTPDLMSDHCDRTWNDAAIETENKLNNLFNELKDYFRDWILQLNIPSKEKMIEIKIKNSIFLTFNYTKTLENLYRVPISQILHIHGCIDYDENFILGHGKSFEELRKMIKYGDPKPPTIDDTEVYEEWKNEIEYSHPIHQQFAEDTALTYIAYQKKPIDKLLKKYKSFFNSLSDVTDIHVYGFSFSEIDTPYLTHIAKIAKHAKWEITHLSEIDKNKINEFINKNKINKYQIIKLEELVCNKQLKITFPKD